MSIDECNGNINGTRAIPNKTSACLPLGLGSSTPLLLAAGGIGSGQAASLHIPLADLQDEEAAYLVRCTISGSAAVLQRALRLIAKGVRGSGDTLAGLMSAVIKATGGIFNFLADALSEISLPLIRPRAPTDRMPHSIEHLGRRIGRGMRALSHVLFAVGGSCILAGDTTEAVTVGLGQSIEDSFRGLELLAATVRDGAKRLLTPARRVRQLGGEYIWYTPRGRVGRGARDAQDAGRINATVVQQLRQLQQQQQQQQQEGVVRSNPTSTATSSSTSTTTTATTSPTSPISPTHPTHPTTSDRPTHPGAQTQSPNPNPNPNPNASPYPAFIEQLHGRFFSKHSAQELAAETDSVSAYRVLLGAFGAWLLQPFSFHSAAGLNPPSISAHVLGGAIFIAAMSSLTYSSYRRRVLMLFCCCLAVWVYVLAMDTVIRKKVESRVAVRAVGSFLREQMEEHVHAKSAKRAGAGEIAGSGLGSGSGSGSGFGQAAGAGNNGQRFFETSMWVNVMLGALWSLDGYGASAKDGFINGGLGPYIGKKQ